MICCYRFIIEVLWLCSHANAKSRQSVQQVQQGRFAKAWRRPRNRPWNLGTRFLQLQRRLVHSVNPQGHLLVRFCSACGTYITIYLILLYCLVLMAVPKEHPNQTFYYLPQHTMYPVGIGSALKRATQLGDREGAALQWRFWKEAGMGLPSICVMLLVVKLQIHTVA